MVDQTGGLSPIHVKPPSKSLGGRLPLFDPISILNIHLPPKRGKLPFWVTSPTLHFSFKEVNCIEFSNENALLSQQSVQQVHRQNVMHDMKSFKPLKRDIISKLSATI